MSEFFIKKVQPKISEIHGVGVFATHDIKKAETIEVSPVLVYSDHIFKMFKDVAGQMHPQEEYIFWWDYGANAVAWGYASLYNHANGSGANASYEMKKTDPPAIEIVATRDIPAGEEVFIHYDQQECDLEFSETCGWRRINQQPESVYRVMFEMEDLWDADYIELVNARSDFDAIESIRQKHPKSFNHRIVNVTRNEI